MASKRKKNTTFNLGLTRKQLVDAAIAQGRTEKYAKKASTKRLEEVIIRTITGERTAVPTFSDREKRDVAASVNKWGVKDALNILTYRMEKIAGARDETNFLRLTISRNFELFIDEPVTSEHIDEIISRLPLMGATQVDSDFIRMSDFYTALFEDYAAELQEEKEEKEQENK